jgi:hypothetical protein
MECVERALTRCVLPDLRSELKRTLLAEAKESVLKACCRKLYNWIKVTIAVVWGRGGMCFACRSPRTP